MDKVSQFEPEDCGFESGQCTLIFFSFRSNERDGMICSKEFAKCQLTKLRAHVFQQTYDDHLINNVSRLVHSPISYYVTGTRVLIGSL